MDNPAQEKIPTVKVSVKGVEGFAIINKSDFDSKIHKKWSKPKDDSGAADKGDTQAKK